MDISSVSFYLIFPTTHIRGNTEDKAGGNNTRWNTEDMVGRGGGAQPHDDVSYRTKQRN